MDINITVASVKDCENVKRFYDLVVENLHRESSSVKWDRSVYPDDPYIEDSIAKSELYIAEYDKKVVAAMVVNPHCNEGYFKVEWPTRVKPDEIMSLHTLAVHPDYKKQGIAKRMVEKSIEVTKKAGKKVIQLDVIAGNDAALKLYASAGFTNAGKLNLFYESVGNCSFDLFEYKI